MSERGSSEKIESRAQGFTPRVLLLSLLLMMNFRTFQYFPGMAVLQEAWYGLCGLALITVYPLLKAKSEGRLQRFEIYLLVLLVANGCVPGVSAWRAFDQPLIYGVLAQRSTLLLVPWLIVVDRLAHGRLTLGEVDRALLLAAWITFALMTGMRLLLDPSRFAGLGPGFVVSSGDEAAFTEFPYFMMYGVFRYAVQAFHSSSARPLLWATILFVGATGSSWRSQSVCAGVTLLVLLFRSRGLPRYLLAVGQAALALALVVGAIEWAAPETAVRVQQRFNDAFAATFLHAPTEDDSANARVAETALAGTEIATHPLLGEGLLSHQWAGGANDVLGEYFYASDIGLVGVVYSVGLAGLAINIGQFGFAFAAARRLKPNGDLLLEGVLAFVTYCVAISCVDGMLLWNVEVSSFFVLLLVSGRPERVRAASTWEAEPLAGVLHA